MGEVCGFIAQCVFFEKNLTMRLKIDKQPMPKGHVHTLSAENVILEKRKNNLWVKYPTPPPPLKGLLSVTLRRRILVK